MVSAPAKFAPNRQSRSGEDLVECSQCPVMGRALWERVPSSALLRFERARKQVPVRRNAVLFQEGDACDAVYTLIDGSVVLGRANAKGVRKAVQLIYPGHTFGFRGMIEGGRHHVSAWCGLDSLLCRIPVSAAEQAFKDNPQLEDVFLRDLAGNLGATQDRMLASVTLGVRERLVLMLAELMKDFSKEMGESQLITTPVSRTDMASLAGMTPETLSRCIRQLQVENLAHFSRRHILIPSKEKFLMVVEGISPRDPLSGGAVS